MTRVVVDADVLGRQRTGDETYMRNLLRELPGPAAAAGLDVLAVTRRPDLVPSGVEAVALEKSVQELRMAWTLPRLLRGLAADLVHTQYSLPLRLRCPAIVTIHDLSFERQPELMSLRDRMAFRFAVPRAARAASRVLTVSERTKADLVELYAVDPARIVVTPNGIDPVFRPPDPDKPTNGLLHAPYVLAVGAVQRRKNQLAALHAAREAGLELVVVGPEKDTVVAEELRRGGARLEGYVDADRLASLYRGAVCLVQASRYEGFGLPVIEAMASGTPVVTVPDEALLEVAGGAAVVVDEEHLADGIRRARAEHAVLVAAGLGRAATFSWRATAEGTVLAYLEALGR